MIWQGAQPFSGKGTRFAVWAPHCRSVEVELIRQGNHRFYPLAKDSKGFFIGWVKEACTGDRYFFKLDRNRSRPDPASRCQPEGVHGPSEITDPDAYKWKDKNWHGLSLKDLVIYEAHIGTLTRGGNFHSAEKIIGYLRNLGVTCLEIMPVNQFPGKHNWGYDGVGWFAPQNSYGGPAQLKHLIDRCHRGGLAVCLDVVYNHLGPEGNYLNEYGPYFTDKYHTPWGGAVNFDDKKSRYVRDFVIQNALYWVREFHVDALRLDAVHAIFDNSRKSILREIKERVEDEAEQLGRTVNVIAESDSNDRRLVSPTARKGTGLDAQWSDDFHHAVHALLTGEQDGYYADYGRIQHVAAAIKNTFVYEGQYSGFRDKKFGTSVRDLPAERFVIHTQNHDQIGNRPWGDRLSTQITADAQKMVAVLQLSLPYTPLLFMGQEYGETAPFRYFVDHEDPHLVKAVHKGRFEEFKSFGWKNIPDPKSTSTFKSSRIHLRDQKTRAGQAIFNLYSDILVLRHQGDFRSMTKENIRIVCVDNPPVLIMTWEGLANKRLCGIFSFSHRKTTVDLPGKNAVLRVFFDSRARRYGGPKKSPETIHSLRVNLPPYTALLGYL